MVTDARAGSNALPAGLRDAEPGRAGGRARRNRVTGPRKSVRRTYSPLFYLPAGVVYLVIFVVPTALSFYFALTRWTLFDAKFIGLDNFRQFFSEQSLRSSLRNTLVYAVVTSGLKVVLALGPWGGCW